MIFDLQDVIFWFVTHKDEVVLDAVALATLGMILMVAVFSTHRLTEEDA